jgi:hypothetical protein
LSGIQTKTRFNNGHQTSDFVQHYEKCMSYRRDRESQEIKNDEIVLDTSAIDDDPPLKLSTEEIYAVNTS